MAGIYCCIWRDGNDTETELTWCKSLKRRGPDTTDTKILQLGEWKARFLLTNLVYANRYDPINNRRIIDNTEGTNILLWIGNIFSGCLTGYSLPEDIFKVLQKTENIITILSQIQGPYSIIYCQKNKQKLYLARDYMGRHSLVMNLSANRDRFTISSCMNFSSNRTIEVPAIGIFVFDLKTSTLDLHPWYRVDAQVEKIIVDVKVRSNIDFGVLDPVFQGRKNLSGIQREPEISDIAYYDEIIDESITKNKNPDTLESKKDEDSEIAPARYEKPEIVEFREELTKTVEIAQGISETVDSSKKTLDVVESEIKTSEIIESENEHLDIVESEIKTSEIIESENEHSDIVESEIKTSEIIESENEHSDILESEIKTSDIIESENEHSTIVESENEHSDIVESDQKTLDIVESEKKTTDTFSAEEKVSRIMQPENIERIMNSLSERPETRERIQQLLELLTQSIRVRLQNSIKRCDECCTDFRRKHRCMDVPLGIMFSGGIDSMIIAALAGTLYTEEQPIELLNVAFEREIQSDEGSTWSVDYHVPDRRTGHEGFLLLKKLYPQRSWRFLECNILDIEVKKFRSERLSDFVDPRSTNLNDNAVCALWFASRAIGMCSYYSRDSFHDSKCRVILVGIGADELFGGYARHRQTLKRDGWSALSDELDGELLNISQKTTGFVNRVISDHGRQPFFPYLDEDLVTYVSSLKAWERCFPTDAMPEGLGDKLLLRLVAREIGLLGAANAPQVSIEIGSGIGEPQEDKITNENNDV